MIMCKARITRKYSVGRLCALDGLILGGNSKVIRQRLFDKYVGLRIRRSLEHCFNTSSVFQHHL